MCRLDEGKVGVIYSRSIRSIASMNVGDEAATVHVGVSCIAEYARRSEGTAVYVR